MCGLLVLDFSFGLLVYSVSDFNALAPSHDFFGKSSAPAHSIHISARI